MNTIIDWFKSLLENIKERAKNPFTESNKTPFAGAFLIALILYNWELFFSLINFDPVETRESKIGIIKLYLQNHLIQERIGYPVGIAFLSILFYYILNNLSLVITTVFNKWVKPFVLLLDSNKLVPKEELDRVIKKVDILRKINQETRESLSEAEELAKEYKGQLDAMGQNVLEENKLLQQQNDKLRSEYETKKQEAVSIDEEAKDLRSEMAKFKFNPTVHITTETTIGSSDPVLAKADFLLSRHGTVATWIKLPPVTNFYKEVMSNRYILSHDTHKGRMINNGYQNAFGFCISPNFLSDTKRLPTLVYFRVWFTNEQGAISELSGPVIANKYEGWCHVGVRWNRVDSSLELLVDGQQVASTTEVRSWPQKVMDNCVIGNWAIDGDPVPYHSLVLPLHRLVTAPDYLPNYWFREEMKSHRPT